ncbi:acyl-[acyl-carrier-protein]-phospholipid O-acyltransferase / long-chain-fatty-acid--[acyl-carrier-protein] ligase [Paenibacillus sp. 1_12]|uniref:AMP-binding protein n=1 Tax=Paenibacillus sp. 1_12 TaxID=1566278 RepID=UPI0008F2E207|nr:AMP-binding protein [Paenibacillus sp. 1_12]SFL11918.1 acyl-[acyl-carrier-protein]-phospholipid O-acyltransferase / long-chain-fatty-acid--[acyl-carrier-protein] ligase [Paenibacillus sp. 1_12]
MSILIAFLKGLFRIVFRIVFRLKLSGLEKLDFSQPTILMPNHVSLLDALLLALYLPQEATFVVNTSIARRLSLPLKLVKHITVDPLNPYSVRKMVKTIQSGVPLVLFPEGRITTTGGLMKIYSGIAYIALKTGAQLIPIAINGAERSKLSYIGHKIKTVFFPEIRIQIGDHFRIEQQQQVSMKLQKQQAADTILTTMQEHLLKSRLKTEVNLFNELRLQASLHGQKSLICEDLTQSLTYKKLIVSSYVFGRKLRPLLNKQAAIGLLLPNSIGHVIALFALLRLGKTPAMLNFSAGQQSLLDACETAVLRTIVTSRQFVEKAKLETIIQALEQQCAILYLEDIKDEVKLSDKLTGLLDYWGGAQAEQGIRDIILFTSGSESKPKGVILGHDQLFANIQQCKAVFDFTAADKMFNALPMFHSFGLTAGTLLPILTGVPVMLYPSPLHYRTIPEVVYNRNATILFGTSTFLAGYGQAAHPFDFQSLRIVVAGAEKLKDEVRDLWSQKFGIRIFEGYGATEASPVVSINSPLNYKRGTVGKLLPSIRYKLEPIPGIEQGGNLLIQGPNIMKGYLIHGKGFVPCPEWYDCGDIVELDAQGFLSIKSRLKRFAKIGGEMISLQLVEELAASCYGDIPLAAISVTDSRKGERILLFATKKGLNLQEFKGKLNDKGYTPMLLPSRIQIIDKLPLLGSGKTDYVALKKQVEAALEQGA